MKYIIYILLFITILNSCSTNNNNNNIIIPADSMANILADIHIADATLNEIMNKERFTKVNNYYYSVLQKHNISRARLDSSISYYSSRGKEYEAIYENVLYILNKKESKTTAEKKDTILKKESIKNYNLVIDYKSNFDTKKTNKLLDNRSSIRYKSASTSVLFDYKTHTSKEFIHIINYPVKTIKLVLKMVISLLSNKTKTYPAIVIEIYDNNKIEQQTAISLKDYIVEKQEWSSVNLINEIDLPNNINDGKIKVYISNPYENDFFIDDFDLKLYVK